MRDDLSPAWRDPVIEVYKRDVDRALLRENLKLTPAQRLDALTKTVELCEELRLGMKKAHVKRAAGRPKDLEAIAELEALREERDAGKG